MASEDILTVRDIYAAFARRDIAALRDALAPETAIEVSEGLPWSGSHKGPDGLVAFLGELFSHLELQLEIEDIIDAGGVILQVGHTSGRVLANGTEFRARELHSWRFEDGKLVAFRVWVDVPTMQAALAGEQVEV